MTAPHTEGLQWMLQRLVDNCDHIEHVVALTDDGLMLDHSSGIATDVAETYAALASAIIGTSRAVLPTLGASDAHRQTTIEFDQRFVLLCAAGENSSLVVTTTDAANLGTVAYEAQQLILKLGDALSTAQRVRFLTTSS